MQIGRDSMSLGRRERVIHSLIILVVVALVVGLAGVFFYKNFYKKSAVSYGELPQSYIDQLSEEVTDKIVNDLSASALATMIDKSVARNLTEQKVTELFNNYIDDSGAELSTNQKAALLQYVKQSLMGLGFSGDNVFSDVQKAKIADIVSVAVSDSLKSDNTKSYLNGVLLDFDTADLEQTIKNDLADELTTVVGEGSYSFTDDDIATIKEGLKLNDFVTQMFDNSSVLTGADIEHLEDDIVKTISEGDIGVETKPVKGVDYFTEDEIAGIVTKASNSAVTMMDSSITDLNTMINSSDAQISENASSLADLNRSLSDTNSALSTSNAQLSESIVNLNTALDNFKVASKLENNNSMITAETALKEKALEISELIDAVSASDLNEVEKSTAKSYADEVQKILTSYQTSNDSNIDDITDAVTLLDTSVQQLTSANAALIDSNTANISKNQSRLDVLNQILGESGNAVGTVWDNINANIEAIGNNDAYIEQNKTELTALNENLSDTNSALETSNMQLSTSVGVLNTALENLKTATKSDNEAAIQEAKNALRDKATEISNLIDAVSTSDLNEVEKSTAKAYADEVQRALDSYQTSNNGNLDDITKAVSSLDTSVGNLTSANRALIDTNVTNINKNKNRIDALDQALGDSGNTSGTLWDNINSNNEAIERNKAAINSLTTDAWIDGFTITSDYFTSANKDASSGCYVYVVENSSLTKDSDISIDYETRDGFFVSKYEQGTGFVKIYIENPTKNITIKQIHVQNKPSN